jgi:hypothetical protein
MALHPLFRPNLRTLAATGLAAIALTSTAISQAAAQPDLVPQLSNPMNATVGVQNIGDSASGPSHLTINCTKFGKADGGCPDIPGLAAYIDPAYPNRVVVDVPVLEPSESFDHVLAFWGDIPWTPGTYIFDAEVDAGNEVAESNEANNTTQSSYTQQPMVGVAPPPPLPLTAALPGGAPRPKPALRAKAKLIAPQQPAPQKLRVLPARPLPPQAVPTQRRP